MGGISCQRLQKKWKEEETRKAAKDAEFWLWLDYISK
jgi:hypothetical protein